MCPTHCWTFPSEWKHLKLILSKPNSPKATQRSLFPLCCLRLSSWYHSPRRDKNQTHRTRWSRLSRHQIIPNSLSPAWVKALVLNCPNQLYNDLPISILPILKATLDPAASGTHPKYNADRTPRPHPSGMYSGENHGRAVRPSKGDVVAGILSVWK